jgi:hypothetical protein
MNQPPRFVYFMRPVGQLGPIKIGNAEVPGARLITYMAWSPVDLEIVATVPGGFDLERNIHECFADHHRRGEWFDPAPKLLAAIEALKRGEPITNAIDLSARKGSIRSKIKLNIHPLIKQRMLFLQSLNAQLRNRGKRMRKILDMPDHIQTIVDRWRGDWRDPIGTMICPTPAEMEALIAFKEGLPDTAVARDYPDWARIAA